MFSSVGCKSNHESTDIPEWKRLLIMRKRGLVDESKSCCSVDNARSRGPVSPCECCGRCAVKTSGSVGTCDNHFLQNKTPMLRVQKDHDPSDTSETVIRTIGNIKVELRSVYRSPSCSAEEEESDRFLTSPLSEPVYPEDSDEAADDQEDLQYGPGIVDRLRARFLNLGLKKRRKPVVRRFSSLENLSGGNATMFRSNGIHPCGERRMRGATTRSNGTNLNPCLPNFKKAQSMETLLIGAAGDKAMLATRSRVFSRNPSAGLNNTSSRQTSTKRGECTRQLCVSSINEDELPKPDTVKHFKKIFESPPSIDKACPPVINNGERSKPPVRDPLPVTGTPPAIAIPGNVVTSDKRPTLIERLACKFDEDHNQTAKPSAKPVESFQRSTTTTISQFHHNPLTEEPEDKLSPSPIAEDNDSLQSPLSQPADDDLSPAEEAKTRTPNGGSTSCDSNCESLLDANRKVIEERQPSPETSESSATTSSEDDEPSQGSQVADEPEQVTNGCVTNVTEQLEVERGQPHPDSDEDTTSDLSSPDPDADNTMVVASSPEDLHRRGDEPPQKQTTRKANSWQKPPPATTSIVFDFRGKDVKPSIPLKPTPFGCKPAKVKKKKRATSPPRTDGKVNGVAENEPEIVCSSSEDEEDWDELDVGAHLPAVSGIVFVGENVKVGRGALLEKRNKNLTIQFDDEATSTFEYPCENTFEENGHFSGLESRSSLAINSLPNPASDLSCYTPHVLSTSDFQLGMSRPPSLKLNSTSSPSSSSLPTTKCETQVSDVIIPADPDDSSGWSSAETADILF